MGGWLDGFFLRFEILDLRFFGCFSSLSCIVHVLCLHGVFGSCCQSSDVNVLVTLTVKWLFGSAEQNTILTAQHKCATLILYVVTLLTGVDNKNDNEDAETINMRNVKRWWRVDNCRESKGCYYFVYVNHNMNSPNADTEILKSLSSNKSFKLEPINSLTLLLITMMLWHWW